MSLVVEILLNVGDTTTCHSKSDISDKLETINVFVFFLKIGNTKTTVKKI